MASPEDHAYGIMRELDVDYVLVIFGGLIGYSSDGEWPAKVTPFRSPLILPVSQGVICRH